MTMFKSYVHNSMYATYTIWQYEMCILRYVLTCPLLMSKLSFYTDVNPCNQKKKHPTRQNISLVREEDIKMLALQSKI